MIGDVYGVVEKSWVWREWKKLSVKRVKKIRVMAESERRVVRVTTKSDRRVLTEESERRVECEGIRV